MAHVGSTYEYCQVISAHSQEQEQLMAPFPLSEQPFERLALNEMERRHFHTQATELLGNSLKEYEEYVLIRHRQIDKLRWKVIKTYENIAVYRESRSYIGTRSLSLEDDNSTVSGHRRCISRSSSSSGGSVSGTSVSLPAHQVTELELLTGWGPTANEARERKKKKAQSKLNCTTATLKHSTPLLGVGTIVGSLDDVMYGIAAPDCASMALKNASLYHDAVDGDVLAAIELPTQRSPFRFLGIKWLVKSATGSSAKYRIASPIDLVYLEATGIITRGDGVRIGYQIVHSVKLRGCPELNDSHGVIRARCDSVYLFIELNNKTVDVFIKSNVMPNERISESASLQSCAESLLHCGRTVESSQNKKLVWQLECSGNLRRKHKQEQKVKATHCSVCNKTFGRFLRHSFECKLCLSAMCSKCCVESTLKSVDVSSDNRHTNKTVLTIVVELCTSCVAANLRASALTLAREEVTSGRFGRASSTSLLSSGQHRGSNNSADGSSVATIAIEDIPSQREHHTRPPRRSDESVRKGHHLQARESRRSHRDQGSSRDDPEPGKCGREHQSQNVHVDVSETLSRKGHAHRDSPSSQPAKHLDSCKSRVRSGSDEPTNPDVRVRPPTFRRGRSGEMRRYVPRTEDTGRSKCDIDHFPLPKSILNGYHHSGDADIPLKLDHLGRGDRGMPVTLCDLDSVSPYKMSKESIRKTASSSGSSLASINTASLNTREPEAEDDAIEFRDTFDSFGDLLDIHDDLDDVYETLDTKDMAAVKRSSQVHSQLWQQIAELRDAAENVYQYTKESTEMHITQGGSVRFPECAPASK